MLGLVPTIEQDTSCTLTWTPEPEGTPGSCSSSGALSVPDLCSDLLFLCCSLRSETSLYKAYRVSFEPATWIWTFCVAVLHAFRILLLSVIFLLCFLYLNCCVVLLCMTKSCLLHLLKVRSVGREFITVPGKFLAILDWFSTELFNKDGCQGLESSTTRKKTMKYKDCRGLKGSCFLWLHSTFYWCQQCFVEHFLS